VPILWWQAALFWLAVAAGILLKGPITPMVVGLAAVSLCVAERRGRWLRRLRPGWGVPLLLAAVMPWFVAIGIATRGQFFAQAVGGDLGGKLAGGAESHGGFPGLHLLLLPLLCFPATLPVLRALPGAWAERRDAGVKFLLAWVVPSWIVFEAAPTKLPHYTLPLYPALFLLAARFLISPVAPAVPRWMRLLSRAALVLVAAIIGAGAVGLAVFLEGPAWLGLPALACCVLVAGLAWQRRLVWALAAAPVLYGSLFWVELAHLPALWIAPRVEVLLRDAWPGWNALGDGLVVAGYAEPSLMFLAGTDLVNVSDGADAAAALAKGSAGAALVSGSDVAAFRARAGQLGIAPRGRGMVRGFNYSRGRWVELDLFVK
jgi:4-amino-4-deoxy-L-arabinose transferase-like glycosyltransferase